MPAATRYFNVLLLVIQSSYTDTDVVLELWPSLQTTDVGVDDDGDCFYIDSSSVIWDDYDIFIFIHLDNLDWHLYYNTDIVTMPGYYIISHFVASALHSVMSV